MDLIRLFHNNYLAMDKSNTNQKLQMNFLAYIIIKLVYHHKICSFAYFVRYVISKTNKFSEPLHNIVVLIALST